MRIRFGLLVILLLGALPCLDADILYSVTDLGTLGGSYSAAFSINGRGQVVGQSETSTGAQHAFLYTDGQMQDLGTLAGGSTSYASGINNAAQVVGTSDFLHAFLYSNGQMMDLGTLGGSYSAATGINDRGQIVGQSDTAAGAQHAFLYSNGQMVDLGTLDLSVAWGLNDAGQVVGYASGHAFLYMNGQIYDLNTLIHPIVGVTLVTAVGINDIGQVVGSTEGFFGHAYLYSNGQVTDLGTLPGHNTSGAGGINNSGEVVGTSSIFTELGGGFQDPRAFVYRDGQMYDLNALIDPNLGLRLTGAAAINEQGQIVANATNSHAYLLTPVPEPSTLALLAIGSAAELLAFVIRRRKMVSNRLKGTRT